MVPIAKAKGQSTPCVAVAVAATIGALALYIRWQKVLGSELS